MLPKPARQGPHPPTRPTLSVVVPAYNVAAFLPKCLDSILAQDVDLEVVIVDDGSTDGSRAIAEGYARRNRGIQVLSSAHQGPGAARNLGIRQACGEFLTFADSDDVVAAQAYSAMVATLEESGSDFVVGSVRRLVGGRRVETDFQRRLRRKRGLRVAINDDPEALLNVYVWNKLFRRSFWDRAGLRFPSGLRYEDQVTVTEAYLRAHAFDVIPRVVYLWRVRSDGSSITQRRNLVGDLNDRLVTKRMTTELVETLGAPEVIAFWLSHGLGGDLPLYFRRIPGCSDQYWQRLVEGVRELFAGRPPIWESRLLRVHQRLVGWLVTNDRRDQAETVIRWLAEHPGPLPLETRGNHVVACIPFHGDPASGIPVELFRLADHELRFDARVWRVAVEGDTLLVSGGGVVRGAPTSGVTCSIEVALRSPTGVQLPMTVEPRPTSEVTTWVDRLPQRYDEGGFVARIGSPALWDAVASGRGPWRVIVSVTVDQIARSGLFRSKADGVQLPLVMTGDTAGQLQLDFRPEAGLVLTHRVSAD